MGAENGKKVFDVFFDGIRYKVIRPPGGGAQTVQESCIAHVKVPAESRLMAEFNGLKWEGKIVAFNTRALKVLGAWERRLS